MINKSVQFDFNANMNFIPQFHNIITIFLKHIRQNKYLSSLFKVNFQNEAIFFQMFSKENLENFIFKIFKLFNELITSINNMSLSKIIENPKIFNLFEEKFKTENKMLNSKHQQNLSINSPSSANNKVINFQHQMSNSSSSNINNKFDSLITKFQEKNFQYSKSNYGSLSSNFLINNKESVGEINICDYENNNFHSQNANFPIIKEENISINERQKNFTNDEELKKNSERDDYKMSENKKRKNQEDENDIDFKSFLISFFLKIKLKKIY